MSYEEEQRKRSRVVVETPTARREVVEQQTVRYPPQGYPPDRRGYSAGILATVALVAIAATAIVFLFLTNSGDDSSETNVNIRAGAVPQATPFTQAPVVVQTPMMQPTPPPVIIQQVPTTTQPAPVIIQAPPVTDPAAAAPPTTAAPAAPAPSDDSALQQRIDKSFADDAA